MNQSELKKILGEWHQIICGIARDLEGQRLEAACIDLGILSERISSLWETFPEKEVDEKEIIANFEKLRRLLRGQKD